MENSLRYAPLDRVPHAKISVGSRGNVLYCMYGIMVGCEDEHGDEELHTNRIISIRSNNRLFVYCFGQSMLYYSYYSILHPSFLVNLKIPIVQN